MRHRLITTDIDLENDPRLKPAQCLRSGAFWQTRRETRRPACKLTDTIARAATWTCATGTGQDRQIPGARYDDIGDRHKHQCTPTRYAATTADHA